MSLRRCCLTILIAASMLAAPPHAQAQNDGSAASSGPIVILITMDGFPARALKDPHLPMPALRALAASGAQAESMLPINPTVTWPNHTALITGVNAAEHHVVANGLVTFPADGSAPEVEPWVPKARLVHARTLYEAAAAKGMQTGQADWVAIYGTADVRWPFGEQPDMQQAVAQDLVQQKLLTAEQITHFNSSNAAWRDEIWTDAAIDMLGHHTPNLLLLHLLQTDSLQHQYGPLTPAAYAAYAFADRCIARVVDAVRHAGLGNRVTFVLASDHGFATYTHTISASVALQHAGADVQPGSVVFKAEGGVGYLYVRDHAQRAVLVPRLKAYFTALPGVAGAYSNQEAQALGFPASDRTDQAPDVVLAAKPDYAFTDETAGPIDKEGQPRGAHGYLNSMPEMGALFIASGAGIRPGVRLGAIDNLRVAPTIARVLGLSLPDAREQPLTDILNGPSK